MEALFTELAESAQVLGLSVKSDLFKQALAVGVEALDAGVAHEAAFEIARAVLVHDHTLAAA